MTFHKQAFRKALGAFPTGVTVITTMNQDNQPVGFTCSSFNAVSLAPPLVLWSLQRESTSLDAFLHAKCFGVHILEEDQTALSTQFASIEANRFKDIDFSLTTYNTPDLSLCSTRFECKTAHEYDGGDHIIFVGEVVDFRTKDTALPLIFHNGHYASVRK